MPPRSASKKGVKIMYSHRISKEDVVDSIERILKDIRDEKLEVISGSVSPNSMMYEVGSKEIKVDGYYFTFTYRIKEA